MEAEPKEGLPCRQADELAILFDDGLRCRSGEEVEVEGAPDGTVLDEGYVGGRRRRQQCVRARRTIALLGELSTWEGGGPYLKWKTPCDAALLEASS